MINSIQIAVKKTLFTHEGPRQLEYDFTVIGGELLGIFGPSGVGKTTLLRMIAGLTLPDEGVIIVDGCTWFDSVRKVNLPVQERKVGMVFQDHSLFPNMTVAQNLIFSLRPKQSTAIIDEVLESLGLSELRDRRPALLSGGQCQRVALARTLVNQPQLMLLDEPFSSLDWSLRWKLQNDFLVWHKRFGCTSLLVSHDLLELSRLADRIQYLGNTEINPEELLEASQLYHKMAQDSYRAVTNTTSTTG